jgi:flagellar protein FliL
MSEVQSTSAAVTEPIRAEEDLSRAAKTKKAAAKSKAPVYILVVLAVAAAGAYSWLRPAAGNEAVAGASQATLPLEPFVVNLDGSGQRAYLRVGITLGFSGSPSRNKNGELPVAPIRDAILSVLSSARPERLLTSEGKEKLKSDLLKTLQDRAPELGVENVYFTEFLVQM